MTNPPNEWIHPYIHKSEKHRYPYYSVKADHHFYKCFDLVNDEVLLRAGVQICAVTEVEGAQVKNLIVFRRDGRESFVNCIHTPICQFVLNPDAEDAIEILSTEKRPDLQALLAPEEHYVAMKSFVGYLAEKGVLNSLVASYETGFEQGQEPLDFNYLMRIQLVEALVVLAPEAATDLVYQTLKNGSSNNIERLRIILSELDPDEQIVFENHQVFDLILLFDPSRVLEVADILRFDDYLFAEMENLPERIIRQLLINEKFSIDLNLSNEILYKLIRDEDPMVRNAIARKVDLPEEIIQILIRDQDPKVRSAINKRERSVEEIKNAK